MQQHVNGAKHQKAMKRTGRWGPPKCFQQPPAQSAPPKKAEPELNDRS